MSFPSVSSVKSTGYSYDGIRLPQNMQVKSLRVGHLKADYSIVNPAITNAVVATGAFTGSVTARLSFLGDGDRVAFALNPIPTTASAGASAITVAALIPAKFRPVVSKTYFARGFDNSTAATLLITVATTGNVTITVGAAGANFQSTGNLSMDSFSGSYSLRA
uniref:Uncharacterized protein n=1 Tax=Clandestinovirus TaxID=2831644 RepID=A0A8F8KP04_9VIRU|nr:hypothetical protein KOM_12_388 [Clandestinovirus]